MLVNLTPHVIVIRTEDGADLILHPTFPSARVSSVFGLRVKLSPIEGVPVFRAPTFRKVEGLPEPQPGVLFVVSKMVADACEGRPDVLYPGTGPDDEAIRGSVGQVVAVTRLYLAPRPVSCSLCYDTGFIGAGFIGGTVSGDACPCGGR